MNGDTHEFFWDFLDYLKKVFPALRDLRVRCPAVGEMTYDLYGNQTRACGSIRGGYMDLIPWTVVHLNDSHRWSRDEIADWLDLISAEHGLDLTLPTPTDIPPEPGEEAVNNTKEDGA